MSHFIDARFWLDDDGKHVWVRHQCGPRENTTMLPWPKWQATAAGRVEPSVICQDCDLHVIGQIEPCTTSEE